MTPAAAKEALEIMRAAARKAQARTTSDRVMESAWSILLAKLEVQARDYDHPDLMPHAIIAATEKSTAA